MATVDIYLIEASGNLKIIAKGFDKARLIHFSDLATVQLKEGGPKDPRVPKGAVCLHKGTAEEKAAARIIKWIARFDPGEPKQLTLASLGVDEFDQILYTYATANAFRLKRELRGDDIRDAIYEYIHQGAMRFDEFAMVVEWLAFDRGLVKTAIHDVMHRYCKGGVHTVPEMDKVEKYAKEAGMWKGMLEVAEQIKVKMAEKDAADAADAVKRQRRAVAYR